MKENGKKLNNEGFSFKTSIDSFFKMSEDSFLSKHWQKTIVVVFALALIITGVVTFQIWYFLAALVSGVAVLGLTWFAEEDCCSCDVDDTDEGGLLVSGILTFLLLWPIYQLTHSFLLGAFICTIIHMFRRPILSLLDLDDESFIENIKEESDWFFPPCIWYFVFWLIFCGIGYVATNDCGCDDKPKEYKSALTRSVYTQVEDNSSVYYIVISSDTLRCKIGKKAIWLNPEGGDNISYALQGETKQQVYDLVIVNDSLRNGSSNTYEIEKTKAGNYITATTKVVKSQIESGDEIYYIVAENSDTLRCGKSYGAVWLTKSGGDRIKYLLKQNTGRQKVIDDLIIISKSIKVEEPKMEAGYTY